MLLMLYSCFLAKSANINDLANVKRASRSSAAARTCTGCSGGGLVGRGGKRVGWYGLVGRNVCTAPKGVCVC